MYVCRKYDVCKSYVSCTCDERVLYVRCTMHVRWKTLHTRCKYVVRMMSVCHTQVLIRTSVIRMVPTCSTCTERSCTYDVRTLYTRCKYSYVWCTMVYVWCTCDVCESVGSSSYVLLVIHGNFYNTIREKKEDKFQSSFPRFSFVYFGFLYIHSSFGSFWISVTSSWRPLNCSSWVCINDQTSTASSYDYRQNLFSCLLLLLHFKTNQIYFINNVSSHNSQKRRYNMSLWNKITQDKLPSMNERNIT